MSSANSDVDVMLKDWQQLDKEVEAIRSKHNNFLDEREQIWKAACRGGVAPLPPRGRDAGGGTQRQDSDGPPTDGAKDSARSGSSRARPQSLGQFTSSRTAITASQMRALSRFADIDMGKLTKDEVFHKVAGAEQRVETRLEFFRRRQEQITPRVEMYVVPSPDSAEGVVDVFRLLRSPRLQPEDEEDRHIAGQESPNAREPAGAPGVDAMIRTPSPGEHRVESAQSRAERLLDLGRQRDERVSAVRDEGRRLLLERRLWHFDEQQVKAARRAAADRDRVLFTWVAAALVMEVIDRVRNTNAQISGSSYARIVETSRSGSKGRAAVGAMPGLLTRGHWRDMVCGSRSGASLPSSLADALAETFRRRWETESRAMGRKRAHCNWRRAFIASRFMVALHRKARCHHAAEVVKDFLEAVWMDNKARHALKTYLRRVKLLQRQLRTAFKFRQYVCKYIYLPAVWEIETRLLARGLGISNKIVREEIDAHRKAWDPALREREAQALSDLRYPRNFVSGRNSGRASAWDVGSVCSTRRTRNSTMVTPQGRCIDTRRKATESLLGDDLERHRLSAAERDGIIKSLLHQGTARYWLAYQDYCTDMREVRIGWQQWKLEVQAMGPDLREMWPDEPVIPTLPTEVLKLDMPPLRTKVIKMLKVTNAGYLF